jgi:hypothetical protein
MVIDSGLILEVGLSGPGKVNLPEPSALIIIRYARRLDGSAIYYSTQQLAAFALQKILSEMYENFYLTVCLYSKNKKALLNKA